MKLGFSQSSITAGLFFGGAGQEYEWLIEYNFNRPHQSLAYLTPIEHIEKLLAKIRSPVLPMWSAST